MSKILIPGPGSQLILSKHTRDEREFEKRLEADLYNRGWRAGDCSKCGKKDVPTVKLPNKIAVCFSCYGTNPMRMRKNVNRSERRSTHE